MGIRSLIKEVSNEEGADLLGYARLGRKCAVILCWAGNGHRELPVLNRKTERIARKIQLKGFSAEAIGSMDGKGISLRRLAEEAGLGFVGKSGLLITERFGPDVRLTGIVTDARIRVDERPNPVDVCQDCFICQRACPAGAIAGSDSAACKRFVEDMGRGRCTVCIDVCPYGSGKGC